MAVLECQICGKTVSYLSRDEVPFRPFCCKRCKMIDLGRWLNEEYRIVEEGGGPTDEGLQERDDHST